VGAGATIKANALTEGDGGKVIVWADDWTKYYGAIEAKGGATSGNGGFVEVSGKTNLAFAGRVDVSAPNGRAGTILLDPRDIIIQDNSPATDDGQLGDSAILFADAGAATDYTISDEALEALTGNIVLQAQQDIRVENGLSGGGLILANQGAGERVVFQAGRHIEIGSAVTTSGAALVLEADSPHQPPGPDDIGAVRVDAAIQSNGGHITLIAGGKEKANDEGGFFLGADVNAGAGGINVSLSKAGTTVFYIGAGGNTQLSSNEVQRLKTTGALVLGEALSAGPAGQSTSVATGSLLLKVDKITNDTSSPIELTSANGSSFQLIAGNGGVFLDRPLTTFQNTVISTTGDVTINETLATSNNSLTINATANVILGPSGAISTGSGSFTCSGTGCPTGSNDVFWDGGGGNLNWFTAQNWSGDFVPDSTHDVTIGAGAGTILINGTAQAQSLVADRPVQISSTESLVLTNASTFSGVTVSGGTATFSGGASAETLALSSGTVNGSGILAVTSDFNQTGGSLGTTFSNLALTKSGNFSLGSFTATGSISLTAVGGALLDANGAGVLNVTTPTTSLTAAGGINLDTAVSTLTTSNITSGDTVVRNTKIGGLAVTGMSNAGGGSILLTNNSGITLNGTVSAGAGSGDAVVLAGTSFTNNAGASALNAGSGRWLVYSGNPASDNRGGLVYGFKQYNATYGVTTVVGSGNGFLYTIAPSITPSLGGTAAKGYDGNTTAPTVSLTASPAAGVIDTDTVSLSIGAASYLDKNAGSGKQVDASGISIASATNGAATVYGYQLTTSASANVGTINPAVVSLSGSRAYDGSVDFTAGSFTPTLSGLVGTETLTMASGTGTVPLKNVGTQTLSRGTLGLGDGTNGGLASNYTLTGGTHTGTITQAALTLSTSNVTKSYDGNTSASGTAVVSSGTLYGTDSVSGGSFAFTDKNMGLGNKTVTVSGVAVSDGNSGGNYTVSYANNTTSTINPAVVSLSGSRAYDGSVDFTAGSFTPTLSGLVGTETLTMASGTGTVPLKNVGTQTLSRGTLGLGDGTNGGLASNYTLTGGTHTGTITQAALTVTAQADNRVYNGTTSSSVAPTVGTPFGTDTISTAPTQIYDTKHVGASKTLTASGLVVNDGNAGNNYNVSYVTNTSGVITARPITVTAATDAKTYDGTTISVAAPVIAGGLGAGDTAAFLQSFDTKNVGTGKTLTPSGTVNDGNGGNNYAVSFTTVSTGTINPATLAYLADTASRNAGDANPPFTGNVTGFVAGETLGSATTGTLAFASPATVTSPEGQYAINGSGLAANNGNYMFVQAPSNATALTVLTITSAAAQSALQTTVNSTNNAPPSSTIGTGTGPQDQALGSSQAFLQTQGGETILLTATPQAQGGVYVNLDTGEQTVITSNETPPAGIFYNEQTGTVVAVTKEEGSGKPVILTGTASSETVAKGGKARLVSTVGCR